MSAQRNAPEYTCSRLACLELISAASMQRLVGRRATCGHVALALARERLVETKLTAGGERCGVGLRLAYRVAQVCNADARDHYRVAKEGGRRGEVVKESNSGAKKNRRDVNADFV